MNTRVLLITGGHGYEREPFVAMWASLDGVTLQEAQYPQAESFFAADSYDDFDVIAFYDFGQKMSDRAKQDFLAMLRRGKGLVFLHHALLGHADWPEYLRIVGGAWIDGERNIDGRIYPQSQYTPNQQVHIQIDRSPHPVTQGLQDFEMTEETYKQLYIAADVTPLLTTTHPKSERLLGWTRGYEQSRIVYLQPGHGATAYNDPNYRRLLLQSIRWAANKAAVAR